MRLVAFMHCAVAMVVTAACASGKEFQKGYAQGSGDTVKRQCWIQRNTKKAGQARRSPYRLALSRIPVASDPNAKVKTVPHEITIPFMMMPDPAARHLAERY